MKVELRALDVTDYASVPGVIQDIAGALGRLDVVVANAGVGGARGNVGEGTFDKDRQVIETNVIGAMATIDAAMTIFRKQNSGQLVAIGSVAGFRGLPGGASYSTSKAAIRVYADAIRAEVHGTPIKVTTLMPGYIDTPINQDVKSRPFLIDVEKGARIVADMIEGGVGERTVPRFPWNIVARLMGGTAHGHDLADGRHAAAPPTPLTTTRGRPCGRPLAAPCSRSWLLLLLLLDRDLGARRRGAAALVEVTLALNLPDLEALAETLWVTVAPWATVPSVKHFSSRSTPPVPETQTFTPVRAGCTGVLDAELHLGLLVLLYRLLGGGEGRGELWGSQDVGQLDRA